jgi:beta-1,2-mannobiose phosphorylase / 1,2-beta-oligomannan phosphorylase
MPRLKKETTKTKPASSRSPRAPHSITPAPRISHTPRTVRSAKADAIVKALRGAAAREKAKRPHQLGRHENNPIVEPREGNFWEMKATFNPGAIYADRRVHLLYRAIGGDDVSVLGYASSEDGITMTERLNDPAFVPSVTKNPDPDEPATLPAYCSGGGWNGGCEDPRLALIDDNVYLMYTAFDGWGSIRIALTSINVKDFLDKNWSWKKPALISPPGEIHKNWMLFPEKINGKYALLHSISPEILVDYFDSFEDLENEQRTIQSVRHITSTPGRWDTWVRGAGPPPIKTKLGWLLFYHAMDIRDPDRYKLGAMILDLNDPTKVLYRSRVPVLEPDMYYENNGFKSGVVYSCGAVVKDGELYVYYGGADAVTCVAMANLDIFLEELAKYGTPQLSVQKPPLKRGRK